MCLLAIFPLREKNVVFNFQVSHCHELHMHLQTPVHYIGSSRIKSLWYTSAATGDNLSTLI